MSAGQRVDWVEIEFVAYDGDRLLDDEWSETPMRFALGSTAMPLALQSAIAELEPGAVFDITLESEHAFGPRNPHLVQTVPAHVLPPGAEVGHVVSALVPGSDAPLVFHVTSIDGEHAKLDGNHPFAGLTLRIAGTLAARGSDV